MSMLLYGKNVVREALRANMVISLYVEEINQNDQLVKQAYFSGIEVKISGKEELSRLSKSKDHQGYVAKVSDIKLLSIEEVLACCKGKEDSLVLVLDGIEDPHNMGAIIRSADAFGVDAIIVKNRNEAPLNATVAKVSTGAIAHVKIASVNNLSKALEKLKAAGFWVVASDGSGKQAYDEVDYSGPIALVIGSEGFGISRLVLSNSDFVVRIPMVGHVNSLNASVATGILLAGVSLLRKGSRK